MLRAVLLTVAAASSQVALADSHCTNELIKPSTPDNAFLAQGAAGDIYDRRTGRTWKRCALGQSFSGGSCVGEAIVYDNWQEALLAAQSVPGWRMPNVAELESIVEDCASAPAINSEIFPNTPIDSGFWTATPAGSLSFPTGAFRISFDSGSTIVSNRINPGHVRLVRID
ncbi:MAG: DUF1566 domain-containing protein [Gammaproteobacteria bacterium]|nr:DUF1566 domain-containing protein [Gammaproteobacteria bacterium]